MASNREDQAKKAGRTLNKFVELCRACSALARGYVLDFLGEAGSISPPATRGRLTGRSVCRKNNIKRPASEIRVRAVLNGPRYTRVVRASQLYRIIVVVRLGRAFFWKAKFSQKYFKDT